MEVAVRPALIEETASTGADTVEAGDALCEWTVTSGAALTRSSLLLSGVMGQHCIALRRTFDIDQPSAIHEVGVEDSMEDGPGAEKLAEGLALFSTLGDDRCSKRRAVVDIVPWKQPASEMANVVSHAREGSTRYSVHTAVPRSVESVDKVASVSQIGLVAPRVLPCNVRDSRLLGTNVGNIVEAQDDPVSIQAHDVLAAVRTGADMPGSQLRVFPLHLVLHQTPCCPPVEDAINSPFPLLEATEMVGLASVRRSPQPALAGPFEQCLKGRKLL